MNTHAAIDSHGLAQRIATEPPIWFGCTRRELVRLAIVAILSSIPITTLWCWIVVGFKYWPPYFVVFIIPAGYLLIVHFHRLKKGRPDGEIYQSLFLFLERLRLTKTHLRVPPDEMTIGKTKNQHVYFE